MSATRTDRFEVLEVEFGKAPPLTDPGIIQIMFENGEPEAAKFLCPCGCARAVYLPLVRPGHRDRPGNSPRWDYRKGGNLVHPSVNWTGGCRSHFWIREDGAVAWA